MELKGMCFLVENWKIPICNKVEPLFLKKDILPNKYLAIHVLQTSSECILKYKNYTETQFWMFQSSIITEEHGMPR